MKTPFSTASSPARRAFFRRAGLAGGAGALGLAWLAPRMAHRAEAADAPPANVVIVPFNDRGVAQAPVSVPKIVKSEAAWKAQLDGPAFQVTREEGTERAYTGPYWDNHQKGFYRCICCDTACFSSDTKYDSGTGWPSFWEPIAKQNVTEASDHTFGMVRTKVSCTRCDAHLGHVFDDGPKPTGLRYCMNSVAMKFIKL